MCARFEPVEQLQPKTRSPRLSPALCSPKYLSVPTSFNGCSPIRFIWLSIISHELDTREAISFIIVLTRMRLAMPTCGGNHRSSHPKSYRHKWEANFVFDNKRRLRETRSPGRGCLSGALCKRTDHCHVSLGTGRCSVPRDLRPGIDNVPELEDAALNPLNADTDWTEHLVCARHLLDIHIELAHVLLVDFQYGPFTRISGRCAARQVTIDLYVRYGAHDRKTNSPSLFSGG